MSSGGLLYIFLLSWCGSVDVLCLTMNISYSADYIFMFYLFFLLIKFLLSRIFLMIRAFTALSKAILTHVRWTCPNAIVFPSRVLCCSALRALPGSHDPCMGGVGWNSGCLLCRHTDLVTVWAASSFSGQFCPAFVQALGSQFWFWAFANVADAANLSSTCVLFQDCPCVTFCASMCVLCSLVHFFREPAGRGLS